MIERPIELTPMVFPTCVGMNRREPTQVENERRVPHVRGDEPAEELAYWKLLLCSPRAWG